MFKKLNIALLVGGVSPEAAVSKESGAAIYNSLIQLGHTVRLIDPGYGARQPENSEEIFAETDAAPKSPKNIISSLNSEMLKDIDLVFLGLHGDWGEDGRIQSLLEMKGFKYTGAGVLASALAMDKAKTKIMFKHYGVETPDWLLADEKSDIKSLISNIDQQISYPCVIKPNNGGSTVGLTICESKDETEEAVKLALKFSEQAIIEKYIAGRELTVAIIGNEALPVLEIKPKHGLYDYECKYTDGMSEYEVPARIPEELFKKIQKQALAAYNATGCSVYGRVDFLLAEDDSFYCLEVNTLPGMTSHSLVPKMAKSVGIDFNTLVQRIIDLSM